MDIQDIEKWHDLSIRWRGEDHGGGAVGAGISKRGGGFSGRCGQKGARSDQRRDDEGKKLKQVQEGGCVRCKAISRWPARFFVAYFERIDDHPAVVSAVWQPSGCEFSAQLSVNGPSPEEIGQALGMAVIQGQPGAFGKLFELAKVELASFNTNIVGLNDLWLQKVWKNPRALEMPWRLMLWSACRPVRIPACNALFFQD